MAAKYKLTKTPKGKKFLYTVTDESGKFISSRVSARPYVACTINGSFYFGRLDLIGKSSHGDYLKRCAAGTWIYDDARNGKGHYDGIAIEPLPIAYLETAEPEEIAVPDRAETIRSENKRIYADYNRFKDLEGRHNAGKVEGNTFTLYRIKDGSVITRFSTETFLPVTDFRVPIGHPGDERRK